MRTLSFLAVLATAAPGLLAADSSMDPVGFTKNVWPILQNRCVECHGPDKQKAELRLDTPAHITKGSEDGKVVVPGKPGESELIERITLPDEHDDRMPAEGDLLSKQQIATLKSWVAAGAPMPELTFKKDIWPIFEESCVECHGPKKEKGELRLDKKQLIFKKDSTLVHGDAFGSDLFFRVSLPPGDEDIMPPEDAADPLPRDQQEKLRKWIAQGAFFGTWRTAGLEEAGEKLKLPEVPEAKPEAVQRLRELGALVMPLSQKTNLLQVDFRSVAEKIGDSHLAHLKPIGEQVAWLNLAHTKVSDDGLSIIRHLPNLMRLHLEHTKTGDGAMRYVARARKLRYLNLVGTEVSDRGLRYLQRAESLRKLFLWKTKVSEQRAKELAKAMPDTKVVSAWGEDENAKPHKPWPEESDKKDKDQKKQAAAQKKPAELALAPINNKCPVSGDAVDPSKTLVHKGRVIGFCCGQCPNKFKGNPSKFVAKLDGFNNLKGRYVRVSLPGQTSPLSLAEVKVISGGKNIAPNGEATQSSVDYKGKPGRAIDGNTSGNYDDGSVTHTKSEDSPWWRLDLGGTKPIDAIEVHNRTDSALHTRLNGFRLSILNKDEKAVYTRTFEKAPKTSEKITLAE